MTIEKIPHESFLSEIPLELQQEEFSLTQRRQMEPEEEARILCDKFIVEHRMMMLADVIKRKEWN